MRRKAKQGVECITCHKTIKNVVPHYKKYHPEIYQNWFSRLGSSQQFVINVQELKC